MLTVHRPDQPLRLDMTGPLSPAPTVQQRVDALWDLAKADRPHLFDGPVATVLEIDGPRLVLACARYRHVVAARQEPGIARALNLRPLAVSGLLVCRDGVVFARRGGAVTQGPGRWELAPSGGLEPTATGAAPDVARQILIELQEELGIAPDQAQVQAPLGLIDNDDGGVVDIVVPLTTPLDAAAIIHAHQGHLGEYDAVQIAADPTAFRAQHPMMLEESAMILDVWGDHIPSLRRSAAQSA